MTRKKTGPKVDADPKSLTIEQRNLMDLKRSQPRSRSTSPNAMHCLHDRASPQKPKRKPKSKTLPSLSPEQIAAQVSARIAELSRPLPKSSPSVKVKSHAELQSSKIARLTTSIAVTEVEIQRLKREQIKAQKEFQRSLEVQRTAALAIMERRSALEKAIREVGEGNEGENEGVKGWKTELESGSDEAKEALACGRPEDVPQILGQESHLTKGVAKTGENVMDKVSKLFEQMERDVEEGTVSEGARLVLDALANKPVQESGKENDNGAILEALARALSLEEGKVKA